MCSFFKKLIEFRMSERGRKRERENSYLVPLTYAFIG